MNIDAEKATLESCSASSVYDEANEQIWSVVSSKEEVGCRKVGVSFNHDRNTSWLAATLSSWEECNLK